MPTITAAAFSIIRDDEVGTDGSTITTAMVCK